jgi:hypothetical protein
VEGRCDRSQIINLVKIRRELRQSATAAIRFVARFWKYGKQEWKRRYFPQAADILSYE